MNIYSVCSATRLGCVIAVCCGSHKKSLQARKMLKESSGSCSLIPCNPLLARVQLNSSLFGHPTFIKIPFVGSMRDFNTWLLGKVAY